MLDDGATTVRHDAAQPPRLDGAHAALRLVEPADHPFLYYGLFAAPENSFRSRVVAGEITTMEGYLHSLMDAALVHYLAVDARTGAPFGHVVAFAPSARDGVCHFEATAMREAPRADVEETIALFVRYLWTVWPFRKLYTQVTDTNRHLLSGDLDGKFALEGTLKEFEYHAGRYWDVYVLATQREQWPDPTAAAEMAVEP